jgi:hypothetical protein
MVAGLADAAVLAVGLASPASAYSGGGRRVVVGWGALI